MHGRSWKLRIWILIGGGLVVSFLGAALFGEEGVARHEKLRGELLKVRSMNEQLRQENRRLRIETEALRDNPEYIEQVIRDELGWVRSDEIVLIFEDL